MSSGSSGTVNKVILIGRLGKSPEVRYTTEGTAVANFSLATDETFTDRAGDKQRRTQWHRIVVWKRLAEVAGEFLTSGKQVFVEGSLRSRKWEDRQGIQRTTFEVVATRMVMLGSKMGYGKRRRTPARRVRLGRMSPSRRKSRRRMTSPSRVTEPDWVELVV